MDPITKPKNFLDFGHTKVLKRDDGIIEVTCGEDFEYDVEHLYEINGPTSRLVNKQRMPVLFMVGKDTNITQDAMKYGSTKESTSFSIAEAYVIHSVAQKILANFYLRIHKPPVPTSFFDSKEKAEVWLKGFVASTS